VQELDQDWRHCLQQDASGHMDHDFLLQDYGLSVRGWWHVSISLVRIHQRPVHQAYQFCGQVLPRTQQGSSPISKETSLAPGSALYGGWPSRKWLPSGCEWQCWRKLLLLEFLDRYGM
jgi:hypothetical protein